MYRQSPSSPVHDSKKYRCLCGLMHVEKGALILTAFVAVLCLAFAFTVFIDPSNLHRLRDWIILHGNDSPSKNIVLAVWYTIIAFFVIWAVINAAIPLAQLSRLPALYMPFLIVKGIGIVMSLLDFLIVIVNFIMLHVEENVVQINYRQYTLAMCVLTLTLIIEGYFYSVVYRAWKYMKLERFEESRRQQHVVAESACSKGGRQRVTPISIQKHVETSFPSAPNYY